MESPLVWFLAAAIAVFAGSAGFFIGRGLILTRQKREVAAARDEASQIRKGSEAEAENLRKTGALQGKEEAFRLREEWEKEEDRRREELERAERHMEQRTDALDRQFEQLSEREGTQEARARELEREEKGLEGRTQDVEAAEREAREKLQGLAGISAEEAKQQLVEGLKDEARAAASNTVREIKEEAQRDADREAKKILALAIQRMAADQTAEMT
ncbi:MAG: DUF3552 domain-containing protein, partial [Gemmatimonadetes bacterium]|nr:DUF3552 domain-containing protein [Gemmatimonadota bacterium]